MVLCICSLCAVNILILFSRFVCVCVFSFFIIKMWSTFCDGINVWFFTFYISSFRYSGLFFFSGTFSVHVHKEQVSKMKIIPKTAHKKKTNVFYSEKCRSLKNVKCSCMNEMVNGDAPIPSIFCMLNGKWYSCRK